MQKGMGDGQGYKTAFLSMQLSEFSAPAYLLFHFVRCRDRRILLYCHFSFCVRYFKIALCSAKNGVAIFDCGDFIISILAICFIHIDKCIVKTDTCLSLKKEIVCHGVWRRFLRCRPLFMGAPHKSPGPGKNWIRGDKIMGIFVAQIGRGLILKGGI